MKKLILVTGANAGMGKAMAAGLCDRGAKVILLCRSEKRGREALEEILRVPGRQAELLLCDLGDLDSVRRATDELKERYDHLDGLVNNAGVITLDRRLTKNGLELQFGVNHIGHFLLTIRLLDLLEQSGDPRIVVAGSGAHKVGKIHFEDVNLTKGYNVVRSYGQSKLAEVIFARELDHRLREKGSRIAVNVADPGAVATRMGVDRDTGFGKGIVRLLKPFFQTPEQGASTAVLLASDPSVLGVTGQIYYHGVCMPKKFSRLSGNREVSRQLFELSETLCGEKME